MATIRLTLVGGGQAAFPISFMDDLKKIGVWEDFVEEAIEYNSERYPNGRPIVERAEDPTKSSSILMNSMAFMKTKKGHVFWMSKVEQLRALEKGEQS